MSSEEKKSQRSCQSWKFDNFFIFFSRLSSWLFKRNTGEIHQGKTTRKFFFPAGNYSLGFTLNTVQKNEQKCGW